MAQKALPSAQADRVTVTFSTLPPSANQLKQHFPARGPDDKLIARTTNTKLYEQWIQRTFIEVRQIQRVPMVAGRVEIAWQFERPGPTSDLSNRVKAAEDLLVRARVIESDRLVERYTAEWADIKGVRVEVRRASADHLSAGTDAPAHS
jgi:Holliday junction resolvase RusA-like endonuclease